MPDIGVVRRRDSDRIETIDAIYVDDRAGELQWALVNTGLFGAGPATSRSLWRLRRTVPEAVRQQPVKDAPVRARPAPVKTIPDPLRGAAGGTARRNYQDPPGSVSSPGGPGQMPWHPTGSRPRCRCKDS